MAPGSRRSARSSTPIPMPVIAEDENSSDPTRAGATTPTPTVPPRSPHRRPSTISSSHMGFSTNSSSLYPPSARPVLSRSSSVPQYVPKRVPGIRAIGGEVGSVRSIPLNSNGSERWVIPTVTDREQEGKGTDAGGSVRPAKGIGKTNQSTSAASFRWIIRPVTTYSYVISSSDDPFSPTGTLKDVNLTMIDANQASERLTFSFTMAKAVVPDVTVIRGSSNSSVSWTAVFDSISHDDDERLLHSLSSASASRPASDGGEKKARRRWLRMKREDNNAISRETPTPTPEPAIRWYNQTIVRAMIWARMRASYPANIGDVSTPLINATNVFAPWPFAVELTLEQSYEENERGNGKKAPDCKDTAGNPVVFNNKLKELVGKRDTNVVDEADICRCSYTNYGLDIIASSNSSRSGSP
ncbi:hypothetical protein QBC32DRAFT_315382 [Pseudoneurospora amorphoporcata]|uniref:Uncharacterized protein n=1 Tax=Pseudoneurospora amorphoporcata TaxID=241081 RepID=A0AAN6SFB9_9PEZI|nr:hypothetical protein QBC32DRAFT_315382 [Pseudoneurospora amorphoporcata]